MSSVVVSEGGTCRAVLSAEVPRPRRGTKEEGLAKAAVSLLLRRSLQRGYHRW